MANNRKDFQMGVINDLFTSTSKNDLNSPIIEETKKDVDVRVESKPKEEVKEVKTITTKKRSYNLPTDLLEDIDKIVYMNRDIETNTDLVIKALRKYLSSKENKELLEEYDKLKGGK